MRRIALPALLLAAGLLTQCRHRDPDPTAKPEDQLPPATQTGAGTFGCLVNGKPWTPTSTFIKPGFTINFDPGYHGGNLVVTASREVDNSNKYQYISFGGDQISKPGTYRVDPSITLQSPGLYTAAFTDDTKIAPCDRYLFKPTIRAGTFTITRLNGGVVAGTFEFTLTQPGCDTIRVTQGRFDKQL